MRSERKTADVTNEEARASSVNRCGHGSACVWRAWACLQCAPDNAGGSHFDASSGRIGVGSCVASLACSRGLAGHSALHGCAATACCRGGDPRSLDLVRRADAALALYSLPIGAGSLEMLRAPRAEARRLARGSFPAPPSALLARIAPRRHPTPRDAARRAPDPFCRRVCAGFAGGSVPVPRRRRK